MASLLLADENRAFRLDPELPANFPFADFHSEHSKVRRQPPLSQR